MSIILLGLPNVAAHPITMFSTLGGEPVAGESANLKTEEPKQTARISSVDPIKTKWYMETVGNSYPFNFDGIALVNVSISDGGYFRVTSYNQTLSTLTPNGLSGVVNATGALSRVQESISSPDGLTIVPTVTNLNWSIILDFTTDSQNAYVGTAMGIAAIRMNRVGTPIDYYPRVAVEILESGVVKQAASWKAVSETTQVLLFPFDPSILSNIQLTNIQIKVYGYQGDNGSYCAIDSAAIYYDQATNVVAANDSFYISANQMIFSTRAYGPLPTKSVHYLRGNTTSAALLNIMILDDGAEINPPLPTTGSFQNSVPVRGLSIRPSGYVEIGSVMTGETITVDPGLLLDSGQPSRTVITESAGGATQAGQYFASDSYSRRGIPDSLEIYCDRDTMMKLQTRVAWQKGTSSPFYVILEPDLESKYQLFTSFACVCKEFQASPIEIGRTGRTRGADMFLVRMRLEEKL